MITAAILDNGRTIERKEFSSIRNDWVSYVIIDDGDRRFQSYGKSWQDQLGNTVLIGAGSYGDSFQWKNSS